MRHLFATLLLAMSSCAVGGLDDSHSTSKLSRDGGVEFAPNETCAPSQELCAGECVDLKTSSKHCGECGRPCIDTSCSEGKCTSASDAGDGCPAGSTRCEGACVDLARDATNCGACSATCLAGWSCSGGVCDGPSDPPQTECTGKEQKCEDKCVNVAADHSNCGACGNECGLLQWCVIGVCIP